MSELKSGDVIKVHINGPTLDDDIDKIVDVDYSYYIKGKCISSGVVSAENNYLEDSDYLSFKFDIIRDLMENENISSMEFKDFIYEDEQGNGNATIEIKTVDSPALNIKEWEELIKDDELFNDDVLNIIKKTGYSEYSSTYCAIQLKKSPLFIVNRIVKLNEKLAEKLNFKLTEENIHDILFCKVEHDYYFKNNLLKAIGCLE